RERAAEIIRQRRHRSGWVESVAGRMEKQYSPGRTWEAVSRSLLELLTLGDVLDVGSGDGVLAELLAGQTRSFTCLDYSETMIEAARNRLQGRSNIHCRTGDMHCLPWQQPVFDQVFMLHTLSYSSR